MEKQASASKLHTLFLVKTSKAPYTGIIATGEEELAVKHILLTTAILLSLLLTGCAQPDTAPSDDPIFLEFESQTWQLVCSGEKNDVNFQAAEYFAQLVYRETNGAVSVTVTPDETLSDTGSDADLSLI